MEEEWRPVVGYEDYYEVSSYGRVRRTVKDNRWPALGIMKTFPNSDGYPSLCLRDHYRKRKHLTVHALVLLAFVGPPGDLVCRHLDGNKNNNHLSNLRWGTCQENVDDMRAHGTIPRGVRSGRRTHLTEDDIQRIRKLRDDGAAGPEVAKVFQISKAQVYRIHDRTSWSHVP